MEKGLPLTKGYQELVANTLTKLDMLLMSRKKLTDR